MAFVGDGILPDGGVFGNLRVVTGVLTAADGAGQAIATGLQDIAGFTLVPKSCNTSGGILFAKSSGNITPASCTSGDDWYCTAWGN